jgi:hypothetical protein
VAQDLADDSEATGDAGINARSVTRCVFSQAKAKIA